MNHRKFFVLALAVTCPFVLIGCDPPSDTTANTEQLKKQLRGESLKKTPSENVVSKADVGETKRDGDGPQLDDSKQLDISKLNDTAESDSKEKANAPSSKPTQKPSSNLEKIARFEQATLRPDQPDGPWISRSNLPREIWDVQQMGNVPVGYERRVTTFDESEKTLTIDFLSRTRVSLRGNSYVQTLKIITEEDENGELKNYRGSLEIGSENRSFAGYHDARNGSFRIKVEEKGRTIETQLEWQKNYRGPFAVEQSMMRKPLELGEARTLKYLDPVSAKMVDCRLFAESYQIIPIKVGDSRELMLIRNLGRTGDLERNTTIWVDKTGEGFRSYFEPSDVLWVRLAEDQVRVVESAIDIYFIAKETTFKDEMNILDSIPVQTQQKYVLSHKFKNLKGLFPQTCNQFIDPILENILTITVVPVDARSNLPREIETENEPSMETLKTSNHIDTQESVVQELAKYYLKLDKTPDSVMGNCSKELNKRIELRPFEGQILPGRNTLKKKSGNCVEHALMLASVGRAAKIPCRIALGAKFNHDRNAPKMVFHAWVEYHDGQRWIPVDSTDTHFPVTTDRIKFRNVEFNSINSMADILEVCKLLSDVDIAVSKP